MFRITIYYNIFFLTVKVYREDTGLFSPISFFGVTQYTHDDAVEFCKLRNGTLVKIDDEVNYNQVVEFAESFFANISSEFHKSRFWVVTLLNLGATSVSG